MQKANIFLIEVEVNELPDRSLVIAQLGSQTRKVTHQVVEHVVYCDAVGINTRTAISLSFCHDDLLRLRPTSWAGVSPLCAGSATAPSCCSKPRVFPIVYCSTNHPLATRSLRYMVGALWFTRGFTFRL